MRIYENWTRITLLWIHCWIKSIFLLKQTLFKFMFHIVIQFFWGTINRKSHGFSAQHSWSYAEAQPQRDRPCVTRGSWGAVSRQQCNDEKCEMHYSMLHVLNNVLFFLFYYDTLGKVHRTLSRSQFSLVPFRSLISHLSQLLKKKFSGLLFREKYVSLQW